MEKEDKPRSTYKKSIYILISLIFALLIFSTGVAVGYSRAVFSQNWDQNYSKNISRFDRFFGPFMGRQDMINSHGAIGNIASLSLPTFIVHGPNQAEQVVVISTSTAVRYMRYPVSIQDLKNGQQVVVIGSADDNGRIKAALIRIVNFPAGATSSINSFR